MGIVSLCAYAKGHVLPEYAISNHNWYKDLHGYSYFVEREKVDAERPHAWGKIKLLERQLEGDADWLMWMDCDTYYMNMNTTIESVLYKYAGIPKDEFLKNKEMGNAFKLNPLKRKWVTLGN